MKLKSRFLAILKFLLPLGLGIFLVYYIYQGFTPEDRNHIKQALLSADYKWIALSFFLGILSHLSRAHRWMLLLGAMGYRVRLNQSFYAVMIGYLANMAFPRLGEVSRCGALARTTGAPFQKLFGSVIAERVIDLIMLLSITLFTFWYERGILGRFVNEKVTTPLMAKFSGLASGYWLIAGGIILLFLLALLLKFMLPGLLLKIRNFIRGIAAGFKSVLQVRSKWLFAGHTLFIWSMYFLMYRVCFYSMEQVTDVTLHAVLASFVMGSFGIIATQGGIGAYHGLVAATLLLYGTNLPDGYAFAWIAWSGQTLMILLTGFFSLIALPLTGKPTAHHAPGQKPVSPANQG